MDIIILIAGLLFAGLGMIIKNEDLASFGLILIIALGISMVIAFLYEEYQEYKINKYFEKMQKKAESEKKVAKKK